MKAIFVTGTGTDIGKTFLTAGLIRHFRVAGRAVDALKPVATGFDPANAETSDPGVLLAALARLVTPDEIERIAPWRFAAPLSPDMAARKAGRVLDFDALVDWCRGAVARHTGTLLIEGVGGVMVPLDERHTVLDWIVALRIPAVLVAGSYLGSLSHTLTALDALRRRDIAIRALIVNETPGSAVALGDTVATLAHFADAVPVLPLPRPAATAHPVFGEIAALL